MVDLRSQLVEVFNDTQRFYTEDATLAAAVKYGSKSLLCGFGELSCAF